jgi:rhodanese-related sulfurtransferase
MLNRLHIQVIILVIAGLLLGVINNTISSNRIPWVQYYQDLTDISDSDTLWYPFSWEPGMDTVFNLFNTEKAYKAYLTGDYLFLDARSPEEYEDGHVEGAINFFFEGDDATFEQHLAQFEELATDTTHLVTYCSGTECDASLMLARYLYYNMGYKNISIYFGGWKFWQDNQLPVGTGDNPEETALP